MKYNAANKRKKTMKYDVTIERTETRSHTFAVEAKDRLDAAIMAKEHMVFNFADAHCDGAKTKVVKITP